MRWRHCLTLYFVAVLVRLWSQAQNIWPSSKNQNSPKNNTPALIKAPFHRFAESWMQNNLLTDTFLNITMFWISIYILEYNIVTVVDWNLVSSKMQCKVNQLATWSESFSVDFPRFVLTILQNQPLWGQCCCRFFDNILFGIPIQGISGTAFDRHAE